MSMKCLTMIATSFISKMLKVFVYNKKLKKSELEVKDIIGVDSIN